MMQKLTFVCLLISFLKLLLLLLLLINLFDVMKWSKHSTTENPSLFTNRLRESTSRRWSVVQTSGYDRERAREKFND